MEKNEEQIIESIVKGIVRKIRLLNETKGRVYELKYFHPSGKSLPNGSNYQKGGFLAECRKNKDSFVLSEQVLK